VQNGIANGMNNIVGALQEGNVIARDRNTILERFNLSIQ
jgi:hypothetical protein